MKIKKIHIKNYRLLKDVSLSLSDTTTVIVGRNNTGKTSLAEVFRSFFSENSRLKFEDFSVLALKEFKEAQRVFLKEKNESNVREFIPSIKLELLLDYSDNQDDFGGLNDFILDLDENQRETKVLIKYQLKDGKIKPFFDGFSVDNYKELKEQIANFFETKAFAVDPCDETNSIEVDLVKIKRLLFTRFVNAQRGLDDETHNEKDVLGKSLGNIFKCASMESAPEELKKKSVDIKKYVDELQGDIDSEFQDKLKDLLPTITLFGYPGLSDPNLSAQMELNVESLIKGNTRVFYEKSEHFILPETYNGLGFRNLIYILFRIYEFFREFQSAEKEPKGHIIFIEEPEAHLHPQMQEVFIRQLDKIVKEFENNFNDGKKWPVQFVVSTHSTHLANEVDFDKIRYFLCKDGNCSKVKDLSEVFDPDNEKDDRNFVHKYMTLTKCDLYFADKAILVEGATERILMPEMIKKIDENHDIFLSSNYMSLVEIGGAHAHIFYKFLDFLELQTLIITDIDSIKDEKKGEKKQSSRCACPVSEGTYSSNSGISNWFNCKGHMGLNIIQEKKDADKIEKKRRIAFQIPEKDQDECGRSFEEAFILANKPLFNITKEKEAYEKAKEIGNSSKIDFAIEHAINTTNWCVPKYIEDGLLWLAKKSVHANENNNGGQG